jgi:Ca2+-binding RTX toxin-like protein
MEREPPDTFPRGSTAQILLFLVVVTLIFLSPDYITIFLGSQSTIFHLNPYNVGDDTIFGGSGNDYLEGDENNDLLDDRIYNLDTNVILPQKSSPFHLSSLPYYVLIVNGKFFSS